MNKQYLKIAVGTLLLSVSTSLFSQNVAINTSGNSAYVGAILDLSNNNLATGTVGFLPPYVTLTSATSLTPPITGGTGTQLSGLIVYNTSPSTSGGLSGPGLYFWNNTLATPSWVYLGSGLSGSGNTNYLARWSSPTALSFGIAQDNGVSVLVSQTGGGFSTTSELLVVGATPPSTEINAILGTASSTGAIGVVGGNSTATATNAGVEGYIGTAGVPANAAVAVYGLANAGTGNQVGVEGNVTGAATNNYAGYFSATGATRNYAIVVPSGSGNVGLGITAPASSAILDLTNTNATGGTAAAMVWPENAAPATNITPPFEGEEIYNTTTGCFQFYHSGVWQTAGCPCSTAPPAQTITPSCTKPFGGESLTYSTSVASGASYNWTATSNDGTPTVTGGGTQTVTVTWPPNATTGTVTSALSNFCGSTITNFTTTITADSMTGPSTIYSGISYAGRYYVAAGSTYAWTVTAGGGSLAPSSNYVDVSNATGSFTIQCIVTGAGTCTATLTMPVTVAACGGVISADPNPLSSATNAWTLITGRFGGRYTTSETFSITTTDNNDLVIVALTAQDGGFRFGNINGNTPTGSGVAVTFNGAGGPAASIYQLVSTFYQAGVQSDGAAPIIIYAIPAQFAGTYGITVTRPGNYNNNQEMNFAMALTGFCSIPSVANLLGYVDVFTTAGSCGGTTGLVTAGIGTACPAGGYIFSCQNNIYPPGQAGGVQNFSQSAPAFTWNPTQENVGEPGYTNTTASMGGQAEAAGCAVGTLFLVGDANSYCTATGLFIIVH